MRRWQGKMAGQHAAEIWLSQIKGRASPAKRRVSSLRSGPRRDPVCICAPGTVKQSRGP